MQDLQPKYMNRYDIQDQVKELYEGTHDNPYIDSALECARTYGHPAAIDKKWRWLACELSMLYASNPDEAAACFSYLNGWKDGVSFALSKAILSVLT